MDGLRFEILIHQMARPRSRRVLAGLLGGALAGIFGLPAEARRKRRRRAQRNVRVENHNQTCHAKSGRRPFFIDETGVLSSGIPPNQTEARLQLHLTLTPDGTAQVDGHIFIVSATDGSLPPADIRRPRRLVARGAADATCADLDGDGRAGLARVELLARDTDSGAQVPVVLAMTEHDVVASGIYAVNLKIDDADPATGEVRVRVQQDRRER